MSEEECRSWQMLGAMVDRLPWLTTAERDAITDPALGGMMKNLDTGHLNVFTRTDAGPRWVDVEWEQMRAMWNGEPR